MALEQQARRRYEARNGDDRRWRGRLCWGASGALGREQVVVPQCIIVHRSLSLQAEGVRYLLATQNSVLSRT